MKCLFPFETFPKRHFYAAVSVFLGLGALLGVILLPVSFSMGQERGNPSADGKIVTLPGVKVDLRRRIIDIEAVVCLDEGPLELIACGRGSKEHESIVSLASRAMHIHTALLLIGAVNGHPASRRQLPGDDAEWEWVSPQGDEIEVWMVLPSKFGPLAERPISEFVVKTLDANPLPDGAMESAYKEQPLTGHVENFFNAVVDRRDPISDVESHHRALSTCHLAGIAARLGRAIQWDPHREVVVGDAVAQSFVARNKRAGYSIEK